MIRDKPSENLLGSGLSELTKLSEKSNLEGMTCRFRPPNEVLPIAMLATSRGPGDVLLEVGG